MKKIGLLAIVAVLAISLMSCTRINAGYMGIKVNLLGDNKGAVTEVPPGSYFNINPNVQYYTFPTFVQTYKWTEGKDEGSSSDEAIRFQTSEGMLITADIGITFVVNSEPGTAARLFVKYRKGVDEIIDGILRNAVRDEFNNIGGKYTADQIIGEKKTELIDAVTKAVAAKFAPDIQVQSLSWLAAPRPPQQVIEALNAKVQATQLAIQKENEVRAAKADADKAIEAARGKAESILVEAKAQAEANRLLSQSLTSNLVSVKWIEAWDGKLPQVQSGSNGSMIVDLRQ